jgi:hypothetical protein
MMELKKKSITKGKKGPNEKKKKTNIVDYYYNPQCY